jgi:hypothetical protein
VTSAPRGADQVHRAVAAVHEAAELLLLPEGYPGPLRVYEDHDPAASLAAAAVATGCAVCWSRIEVDLHGRFHLAVYVVGGDGRELGRYLRAHPATGDVRQVLSVTAIAPGPALADLVDIGGVPVGLLVCSELWLPEVARVGARLAMVADPEDDVVVLANEGVLVAHLALPAAAVAARHRRLHGGTKPFRSLPGSCEPAVRNCTGNSPSPRMGCTTIRRRRPRPPGVGRDAAATVIRP